jgi:precorrin-2/cobalt-factor-2 C20-methyltransferase
MAGTLYVVGTGPGDPELMTLKAARILGRVACICVPKGREEGSSLALSIIEKAVSLEGREIVEAVFPMRRSGDAPAGALETAWDATASAILGRLEGGTDVAFVTIGDPSFYSTFFYLYDRLLDAHPGLQIEIVPGVASISACASLARLPLGLGDERIAVLPASRIADLKGVLAAFDTVVLMKAGSAIGEIVAALNDAGFLGKAVCVSRAGLDGQRIWTDLAAVKPADLDYFSMVIVKK